jgi:hypothetical protein
MKKLTMFLVGILLILSPLMVHAQAEDYRYMPGNMEFTLSGSGTHDENFDGTVLSVEAGLGYFLTSSWEVFLKQGFAFADFDNGSDWIASTRGGLNYNFNCGRWKPLIGATVGWLYGDDVKDQGILGPQIGLKYFANPSTFIYGLMEYQFLFRSGSDVTDNWDDGRFIYTVGLGYRW